MAVSRNIAVANIDLAVTFCIDVSWFIGSVAYTSGRNRTHGAADVNSMLYDGL